MPLRKLVCLGLLLAVLSACKSPATSQPTATRAPTATPRPPTATARPAGQEAEMGFTAEGWPYRGNPNAAVTLWEFSEFQ